MLQRFERFTAVISEIHRHLLKLSADEMKKFGLHGTSARILIAFKRNGSMTAAELTKVLGRNKAEISRILSDLEEKGLLEKTSKTANYRVTLRLSEQGLRAAERLNGSVERAVFYAGCELSDEERECLYRALDSISKNLAVLSNEGIPERLP